MTIMTEKEYVESGGAECPFCRGGDIGGDDLEWFDGAMSQEMHCLHCGARWLDKYDLVGFITKDTGE